MPGRTRDPEEGVLGAEPTSRSTIRATSGEGNLLWLKVTKECRACEPASCRVGGVFWKVPQDLARLASAAVHSRQGRSGSKRIGLERRDVGSPGPAGFWGAPAPGPPVCPRSLSSQCPAASSGALHLHLKRDLCLQESSVHPVQKREELKGNNPNPVTQVKIIITFSFFFSCIFFFCVLPSGPFLCT